METIFDQAKGNIDIPHRHDYYTVLFIEKATGSHLIDYQNYPLLSKQVFFVSPGQVHQVNTLSRPKGRVITFSREFLMNNNIPESFISNINLFQQFGDSPPLELDQITFDRLSRIVEEMITCLPLDLHYRNRALGALLQLFLIYCNNSRKLDTTQLDDQNSGICILRDFKSLVEAHFTKWHKVTKYATQIHITPKHLSHTVKILSGKTAKAFIQDRITLEAKRLLLHTQLTVKEVAYRLGFTEPLHFSGFFKKQTGKSPSDFRNEK